MTKIPGGAVHTNAFRELREAVRQPTSDEREMAVLKWWQRWTAMASAQSQVSGDALNTAASAEAATELVRIYTENTVRTVANLLANTPGVARMITAPTLTLDATTIRATLCVIPYEPIEPPAPASSLVLP